MVSGYLACSFDLLNVSDLDVIQQAREQCDRLTVGVYSDDFVTSLNGRPPIVPLVERMTLLRHVRGVDAVVIHEQSADCGAPLPRIFKLSGDLETSEPGKREQLIPRRTTMSTEIRRALSSFDEGAA